MQTITLEYVKDVMVKKYGSGYDRPLAVVKTGSNDLIIYLKGTPPKGYAIAGNGHISFYDLNGRRYKTMTDTDIECDVELAWDAVVMVEGVIPL